jgi:hypothetical protein
MELLRRDKWIKGSDLMSICFTMKAEWKSRSKPW